MPSYTQQVLAVLVGDRHRAIARDFAGARRFRLRRRVAAAFYALAGALGAFGAVLDDTPSRARAA
jgi:hypothetical protein